MRNLVQVRCHNITQEGVDCMPKKQNKINAVIHIPNESALRNLKETTDSLFAYTVKKRLDSLALSPKEKRKIITQLISELNTHNKTDTA